MFFVYIYRTGDNKLYIGHSNNVARREREHNFSRYGAKFIKDSHFNGEIIYFEKYSTRSGAMKREKQLEGWTRAKKIALLEGDLAKLKKL